MYADDICAVNDTIGRIQSEMNIIQSFYNAITERGLRAEDRTTSSADAGHVDPAGSTQTSRVYDHGSSQVQRIDQLGPI